jgi:hypothetical protein
MARQKATVTLDRSKAERARKLIGGTSISQVIDVALDRLIQAERLRRDVAVYLRMPAADDLRAVGDLPVDLDLGDDDVDYDVKYGKRR